jgi:hypothetical protein
MRECAGMYLERGTRPSTSSSITRTKFRVESAARVQAEPGGDRGQLRPRSPAKDVRPGWVRGAEALAAYRETVPFKTNLAGLAWRSETASVPFPVIPLYAFVAEVMTQGGGE